MNSIEILMPALSPTMENGTLSKWLVKVGDQVKSGDIIAEIETDKAIMEFEAIDDGEVTELLFEEGVTEIKVNTPIARILTDASTESSSKDANSSIDKTLPNSTLEPDPIDDKKLISEIHVPKHVEVNTIKVTQSERQLTVREALREAIAEEMHLSDDVFLIGEEVGAYQGAYKVSQGLLDEFGARRVIDTPITEHGFTGLAAGAAFAGLKPIVEFMTFNFAMQAIDQIINTSAKTLYMSGGQMSCPIVFRGPNGAASRVAAQHSQDFSSWYASIPGLKVVHPYSAADTKGLLKSAIRDSNPVIFLENELLYGQSFKEFYQDEHLVPIGKAKILRSGDDVTLVSYGISLNYVIEAANILSKKGISSEVIDLRSLRPLDTETIIDSVKRTNRCVTIEQGYSVCSIGNYVSSIIMQNAFDYLDAPVINCNGKDVPMPYAANLEKEALLSTEDIVNAVMEVSYRS